MMKTALYRTFLLATAGLMTLCLTLPISMAGASGDTPRASGPTGAPEFPSAGFSAYYESVPLDLPDTYQGLDYTLPVDLSDVKYIDRYYLTESQLEMLSENGFVVTPYDYREFSVLYEIAGYDNVPIFATTDAVYHVYHLLFDMLLRDLERHVLEPAIRSFTASMANAAAEQYGQAEGTSLETAARGVLGYFAVAQQLIEAEPRPEIPAPVTGAVAEELALIEAHQGIAESPLFSFDEDYSQYIPRGHYTRSEQLERYFRTMMWYGRINFRLGEPGETLMAILITKLMRDTLKDGAPVMMLWSKVYDPTVFFVGKSDDLSIYDYGPPMDDIYGPSPELSLFADDTLLDAFIEAADQLPAPLINSMVVDIAANKEEATRGFRLMGQRFVLDAYIFDELTAREVEDRWLPKGLDVFAAMGNDEAYEILDEMGETGFPQYDEQLAKLQGRIAALDVDTWTQNLYWNWLYSLQAVISPKDDKFPAFMRTDAWARKDLQAALGSWTELKHDTILYAKQSMAECGAEFEFLRGYVEPNAEAFARLLALTRMTRAGLGAHGLLDETSSENLEYLEEELAFLLDIARRELAGDEITEDEYWRISFFGGWLQNMEFKAADLEDERGDFFMQESKAAIVADVATDPGGSVLEEATGYIFPIYVVVPDGVGGLQVAKGGVYSYYEFAWPIVDRLTDEKWQLMLYEESQPDRPAWTQSFIAE